VKKNFAAISAVMSDSGIASGHLEKQSIRLKQYLNPREGGSQNKHLESEASLELGNMSRDL